jgi:hypothetical protein
MNRRPQAHRKTLTNDLPSFGRLCAAACLLALTCVLLSGCPNSNVGDNEINPFQDLPPITLNGREFDLEFNIVPLGELAAQRVIRITVSGQNIRAVLVLKGDDESSSRGLLAGGGPPNQPFDYRVHNAGSYFVYVLFDPAVPAAQQSGTINVADGDPAYAPPAQQYVRVLFEPGYLSDPGLYDPTSQSPDDQAFFASIADLVAAEIMTRLREVLLDTPIVILTATDAAPAAPVSTVTFSPQRTLADDPDAIDIALPAIDPSLEECQDRVIFGEVLPRGTLADVGNRVLDDAAVVYVGSFQGRGESCQSAAINSVNNIVLGLSHTAAHEIGHLIGLFHVSLTDIMDRSPTQAFQRELTFQPGQVLIDAVSTDDNGDLLITPILLTTILQNPDVYFTANFAFDP